MLQKNYNDITVSNTNKMNKKKKQLGKKHRIKNKYHMKILMKQKKNTSNQIIEQIHWD